MSISFKMEMRNKNTCEKYQRSTVKLENHTQLGQPLCDTEKYISKKSVRNTNSTNGKNKMCSLKNLVFPNITKEYIKPSSKIKVIASRNYDDTPNGVKPRCSKVAAIGKSEASRPYNKSSYNEQVNGEPYDLPPVSGIPRKPEGERNCFPTFRYSPDKPGVPTCNPVNVSSEISPTSADINENNVVSDMHSLFLTDGPQSNDVTNSNNVNIAGPMDVEENEVSSNPYQVVHHGGLFRNMLALGVSQSDPRDEYCFDGSSYSRIRQFNCSGINYDTGFRLPPLAVVQQNRTFQHGLLGGGSNSGQYQQCQPQDRETTLTERTIFQGTPQQRNGNNLRHVLERVRSPEYAELSDRLQTFTRWPSDIVQTSGQLAEAGFYYTGFQDTVRCFACDGGLKNWDLDDDPWIEHARWFPQCPYVRHVKGEEFINLVRIASQESDEEDDYTVHRGAASGGVENSNISADSASSVVTEPSVLENEDAQSVMQMGFLEKDVVMAINDIFKKGKHEFTRQEIADIILEKQTSGEPMNSMLAGDCLPSVGNMSAAEHAMNENRRLKELLLCIECKSRQRNILFLPCTHCVVCDLCSRDLHICTYCFRKIKDKVRTYMS